MTEVVRYAKEGDVAVITIDNPPVNVLGPGVAEGIAAALSQAETDAGVRAIVIDRKSTRLNSSHQCLSRMPSSA